MDCFNQILQKYHSVILYWSLEKYSLLQWKSPMHYAGPESWLSLRWNLASKPTLLEKIFRQEFLRTHRTQECGARLIMVTHQPVQKPSTISFAFSQAKHFFFLTSWKYQRSPIWLKNSKAKLQNIGIEKIWT